jgi:hypothetical protein
MDLRDLLSSMSFPDLQAVVCNRGLLLRQGAEVERSLLVRELAQTLGRPDNVRRAVDRLTTAQLVVFHLLTHEQVRGLSALARRLGAPLPMVQAVLERLRLLALAFPNGDWEHIEVPAAALGRARLPPHINLAAEARELLVPPPLVPAVGRAVAARPGSFWRDAAELLARLLRSGAAITQRGYLNRRDVRSASALLALPGEEYAEFVGEMFWALGLLEPEQERLVLRGSALGLLAAPAPVRAAEALTAWINSLEVSALSPTELVTRGGYPEDELAPARRVGLVESLATPAADTPVTVSSLARLLLWRQPAVNPSPPREEVFEIVLRILLRSLYWLGFVSLDDPNRPEAVSTAPVGHRFLVGDAARHPFPDEYRFLLQPNAEVYSPPNLAPVLHFHLRRLTGERKGAAEGMFPLQKESVRRALMNGTTAGEMLGFLETFSRTGVPDVVRSLIESEARHHGRIVVRRAEYVLTTDTPELLEELRAVQGLAPLLSDGLTERAAAVNAADVAEVMRRLRSRGYSPVQPDRGPVPPPLPTTSAAVSEPSTAIPEQAASPPLAAAPAERVISSALPPDAPPAPEPDPGAMATIREQLRQACNSRSGVLLRLEGPGPSRVTEALVERVGECSAILRSPCDSPVTRTVPLSRILGVTPVPRAGPPPP